MLRLDSFRARRIALALLLTTLMIAPAQAVVVNCPNSAATNDREFSLDTTPGATCLAFGPGNLNGINDSVNQLGYITLDKSDDSITGALEGSLTFTPPTSGLSGSFSIFAPGYTSLVIALKSGAGQLDPDWAAFILPAGVFSGSWSISGQQELSHANLYGMVSEVPLPAALPLYGTGLGLMALFGWWRRRRADAVA
jgi:hypothetical protein